MTGRWQVVGDSGAKIVIRVDLSQVDIYRQADNSRQEEEEPIYVVVGLGSPAAAARDACCTLATNPLYGLWKGTRAGVVSVMHPGTAVGVVQCGVADTGTATGCM